MTKHLFYTVLISLLTFSANAIDLSEVNFSYLYDGSLELDDHLKLKSDTFHLYLKLNKKPDYVKLYFQLTYQDKNHQEVQLQDSLSESEKGRIFFQAEFKNISEFKLLVVEMNIEGVKYYYDISINEGIKLNHPDFSIDSAKDSTVIFENYLKQGEQVLFPNAIFCYAYQSNFDVALPPMVIKKPTGKKKLTLDSVFTITQKLKIDSLNQLLFFQSDSSSNLGRGFVTVPTYFPKMRTSEELIEPLIYLSTKKEYSNLNTIKNKKKGFENFWVRNLKSKERAKENIKKFYRNVAKANQYFTNYKIGWKTDPGMIYTLFGPPLFVQRNEKEEKWLYSRFGEVITFIFEKIPNLFVRKHLRLQRDIAHSKFWFREVSSWRKASL